MRNPHAGWVAIAALLSACCAACTKHETSKELAAVESAYRSGILTSDEYRAKKAALELQAPALAALDKARDAGVLTADEYRVKRTLLLAQGDVLAALEKARGAGILSEAEFANKKAALMAPSSPPPATNTAQADTPAAPAQVTPRAEVSARHAVAATPPAEAYEAPRPTPPPQPARDTLPPAAPASSTASSSSAESHVLRMKVVKAMDVQGFERPYVSASMLVPTDWQFQGGTTWNIKDKCNGIQTTLRAAGPDGRGIEVFPTYNWVWADDPTATRQVAAQQAQYGSRPCDVMPPMSATDFLRRSLGRIRPGAQLLGVEPYPKLMAALQQQARQTEQSAMQYRLQQRVRPDVVRGRVRYSFNGQPVEEWVYAVTIITGTLGPSYNVRTMQQVQAFSYSCLGYMTAERTRLGQLDANEKFFELLVSTYRVNPDWQARISGQAQAIQKIEQKGIADRSAIVRQNGEDIANINRQRYENQQQSQDRLSNQRSQNMRDVETYRNPATGDTVELSNQYGHAWVNNRGEYLLSDQAGFDPSVTFKEDWRPLEHVRK